MIVFHSANNSFPEWKEYNRMIGLGWRKASEGYALQVEDGKLVLIPPGSGDNTNHGARQDLVVQKFTDHPINHEFPVEWKTPDCELYRFARGPAENLQVLSYARDEKTGINWPVDWVVHYGKGRIYNATFGHIWNDQRMPPGIQCVGFQTSLLRAVQWVAHRKVTWKIPADFPDKDHVSLHPIKIEYLPEEGWKELFNGNNLDNWEVKCMPADREKTFWEVKDGAIECNSMGRSDHDYVWLINKDELANFHLVLQFQVFRSSPGNSGVQFRSRYQDASGTQNTGWMNGPQVDIHPPVPFRTGLIYDETRDVQRWIYPSLKNAAIQISEAPEAAGKTTLFFADEDENAWNTLEMICKDTQVVTFVNGRRIADFDGSGLLNDANTPAISGRHVRKNRFTVTPGG